MRVAPVRIRPPQGKPFAALPPVRIIDRGIQLCYAIAIRHSAPPVVGGYLHSPPTLMHKLAEQIRGIKEEMAALKGPLDPRRMKAAVTGLADINDEHNARGRDLGRIEAALYEAGIPDVTLDRHGNAVYGQRMIDFDIEGGALYVLIGNEPDTVDLSRHPRAVKIKIG